MGALILGKIFLKPNLFYGAEISHGQLIAHVKQATIKTSWYTDTHFINFYHPFGKYYDHLKNP